MGLHLNRSKTQLISRDMPSQDRILDSFPDLATEDPNRADVLGAPIGHISEVTNTLQKKTKLLELMGERLHDLPAHEGLFLLKHSLALPKILFLLRTTCFFSPQLSVYDNLLRKLLSEITNIHLGEDNTWLQATLPTRNGGTGIRRASQLAPSAFLASAAGCSELVCCILPPGCNPSSSDLIKSALTIWSSDHTEPPPVGPSANLQKSWDLPKVRASYQALLNTAPEASFKAHLLSVACKESGAWLDAPPVTSLGLCMDNEVIRITLGLCLGAPLCDPHPCTECNNDVDSLGTHSLSCRFSKGHQPPHASINNIIKRSLDSLKIPSHLEPSGLYRSDEKRPDGATIIPWQKGKILVWDATCPNTLAPSHLSLAIREGGAVASNAENRKQAKYPHLDSTHHFIPVGIETLGAFGKEASLFFQDLGQRLIASTSDPMSRTHLLQRISVAIQRGNAASVLGSSAQVHSL